MSATDAEPCPFSVCSRPRCGQPRCPGVTFEPERIAYWQEMQALHRERNALRDAEEARG